MRIQKEVLNPDDENSSALLYFQDDKIEGTDLKTKMLNELLRDFIDEPIFNQLRTNEQLGYVVFSLLRGFRDVNGIGVLVQSTKQPASYLTSRVYDVLSNIKQ